MADGVVSVLCQLSDRATSYTPATQCTLAQVDAEGGVEDRQPPAGRDCSATRGQGSPLCCLRGLDLQSTATSVITVVVLDAGHGGGPGSVASVRACASVCVLLSMHAHRCKSLHMYMHVCGVCSCARVHTCASWYICMCTHVQVRVCDCGQQECAKLTGPPELQAVVEQAFCRQLL